MSHEAHPLHPQWLHSIIFPSSNLSFGTLQIQVVPKVWFFCWIHIRQQSFSYPGFFHLAIRFSSAHFSLIQYSYRALNYTKTTFYNLFLFIKIKNISWHLMMNSENWPGRFRLSFPFMWIVFCRSHSLVKFLECRFDEFPKIIMEYTIQQAVFSFVKFLSLA